MDDDKETQNFNKKMKAIIVKLGSSVINGKTITTRTATRPPSDQEGGHHSIGIATGGVEGDVRPRGQCSDLRRRMSGEECTRKLGMQEEQMQLNALMTIVPDSLNSVTNDGWEEIEMTVDSGASETVVGEEMIAAVATKEGQASRRGVVYEVANGVRIPNLGEKKFTGVTQGGVSRRTMSRFVW